MQELKRQFDAFRKMYQGKKRGLETEWANFYKKYKLEVKTIIPLLNEQLIQEYYKNQPNPKYWKNFQTFINQRAWEYYLTENNNTEIQNNTPLNYCGLTERFVNTWKLWLKYKKLQHNFEYQDNYFQNIAIASLVQSVEGNEERAIKAILNSIGNGYKGIFEDGKPQKSQLNPNEMHFINDQRKYGSNNS